VVLGVDVGGTKVAVAAVDGVSVTDSIERPTAIGSTAALLDGLEEAVRTLMGRVGQPTAIGVGVPSQIEYATGTVETSVNIPLTGVPLRAELGRRFGVPVVVDNDANCAALAEAHILGEDHLVMLTLGTGVGGGVVMGGKTFRGAQGLGAELGHFTLNPDGPPCPGNCPNRGCIEALASGTALAREGRAAAEREPESMLGKALADGGEVSGKTVTEAALEGDETAAEVVALVGRRLGAAFSSLANIFEPQVIVVGGGVMAAGELLLEPARRELRARALPPMNAAAVAAAELGDDAGMIGAATMAQMELGG
jgi:glucokinase